MITRIMKAGLVMVLVLGLAGTGFAQKSKQEAKVTSKTGEIEGEISAMGKNYIAIVYKREKDTEYEMLLPMDSKKVKIERKKDLSELKIGDIVRIKYEDTTIEDSEKKQTMERKAIVISFVKPAPAKPPEPEE